MSIDKNREVARRYIEEVYNQARIDVADELLASDAFYRGPLNIAQSKPAVKMWLSEWLTAFPDTAITPDYWVADEERVVCRGILRGTMKAAFRDVAGSERKIALAAVFLFTFRDGRITVVDAFYDTRAMAEQLGVLLPPVKRFAE